MLCQIAASKRSRKGAATLRRLLRCPASFPRRCIAMGRKGKKAAPATVSHYLASNGCTNGSIVVIGAGPAGLEAAVLLTTKGYHVILIERGEAVGSNVRSWAHVQLFSENAINVSEWGLRACAEIGAPPLEKDCMPTGAELVSSYLEPLHRWLLAAGADVLLGSTVLSVSREGALKNEAVVAVGERYREVAPFCVLLSGPQGERRLSDVGAVLDCSGCFGAGAGAHLGAGGMPAVGELSLRRAEPAPDGRRACWFDSLPDVCGRDRASFLPADGEESFIVLVGGGYSAATTLLALVALARAEPGARFRLEWLLRRPEAAGAQCVRGHFVDGAKLGGLG